MLEPERILRLEDDRVVFLDQRMLPDAEVDVECRSAAQVAEAIRAMVVRGAPAIGIAAAYGYALAAARGGGWRRFRGCHSASVSAHSAAHCSALTGCPPVSGRHSAG